MQMKVITRYLMVCSGVFCCKSKVKIGVSFDAKVGVALCFRVSVVPTLSLPWLSHPASDCPFLSNGLGLSSEGGLTFFPCFSMESALKFIFYLFLFFSQTLTSLLFLSDLFKCCCLLLCAWNTFVHNINVSFGGLCKHFIEVFPILIVAVFRKSSLSTVLLIHEITWVLLSSIF